MNNEVNDNIEKQPVSVETPVVETPPPVIEQPTQTVEQTIAESAVVPEQPVEPTLGGAPVSEISNPADVVKPKKSKLPIIILILVILGAAGGAAYYFLSNNPTGVIKTVFNRKYEDFKESLEEYDDFYNLMKGNSESFKIDGEASVSGSILDLNDLKDDKIKYSFGLDYPSKQFQVGGSIEEKGEILADVTATMIDNKTYVTSQHLFDSVLEVDSDTQFDDLFDLEDLGNIELPKAESIEKVTES